MNTQRLDHAGTAVSILCAVHCAVSPFLLPLLPLAAGRAFGPATEWCFVGASLALGIVSLSHSYRAVHRDLRALTIFATGFAVLLVIRSVALPTAFELAGVVVAATCMVSSHTLNLRLQRGQRGGTCPCPCHDVTDKKILY